jgi:NAD(P)-dependent dehydrogenase (short-subunit alcohol dehydrogenase family)
MSRKPWSGTALVTGAASGIGLAIAERLGSRGLRVVLADVDETSLARAVGDLEAVGYQVEGAICDVSSFDSVESLSKNLFSSTGVDVLVSNAGVVDLTEGRVWETLPSTWQWLYGVNVMGLAHLLKTFVPRMLERSVPGHIVITASELGLMSDTESAVYSSSKHAVVRIAEGLYLQLHELGAPIGVTLLCPGLTATRILESERNRPRRFKPEQDRTHPDPTSPKQRENEDLAARLAEAARPADVADALIDAMSEKRFYCITAPAIDTAIRQRLEDILARRTPMLHPVGVYCGICTQIRPADCALCRP